MKVINCASARGISSSFSRPFSARKNNGSALRRDLRGAPSINVRGSTAVFHLKPHPCISSWQISQLNHQSRSCFWAFAGPLRLRLWQAVAQRLGFLAPFPLLRPPVVTCSFLSEGWHRELVFKFMEFYKPFYPCVLLLGLLVGIGREWGWGKVGWRWEGIETECFLKGDGKKLGPHSLLLIP